MFKDEFGKQCYFMLGFWIKKIELSWSPLDLETSFDIKIEKLQI